MKNDIGELINKAERSIEAAKTLCKSKDYDFAASRTYYAIFYISEALLLSKKLHFSKHKAVISGIYKNFIEPGLLDKSFHNILHTAHDLRQDGDYMCNNPITKEVAEKLINDVKKQIKIGIKLL